MGGAFLSPVCLMPMKDGGQMLAINLKSLNAFVHTKHLKKEGIQVLRDQETGW